MPRFSKKTERSPRSNPTPNIQAAINNLGVPPLDQLHPDQSMEAPAVHNRIQDVGLTSYYDVPHEQVLQVNIGGGLPQVRKIRRDRVSSTVSIGQDRAFNQVCDFLRDDEVGTVGIYGMGGVGKSTLMKKLRREFLEPSGFNVIWVVVSKSVDVDRIQKEIMNGVNLRFDVNEPRYKRVERISKEVVGKKVALLFDDIWDGFCLEEFEILDRMDLEPSNFKVIFTTRLEKVCAHLQPDRDVRVECLEWDDSWELFERIVGHKTIQSHNGIKEVAIEVAKECKGLPLALTVIGKAMTCKYSVQAWKYALVSLQNSSSMACEVEKTLFPRLKISYDCLSSDMEKNCFLYCCVYPEDENIPSNSLVAYWYAEGLLGFSHTMEEACNRGYDIIGILQTANLLERVGDLFSKMHDVIRDMGLWILSEMEQSFFVHDGVVKLTTSVICEKWSAAHKIFVFEGKHLPQQPLCCNLSTLIFRHCVAPAKKIRISDAFFQSMNRVKVLELINVHFVNDPFGIGQLTELRYLYIGHSNLERLPVEVGQLSKLKILYVYSRNLSEIPSTIGQLLDLRSFRFTSARVLPVELGNLNKLECLFISSIFYGYLEEIPRGTFANMVSLKILSLSLRTLDALHNSDLWDLTQLEDLTIMFEDGKVCESNNFLIHGLKHLNHTLRRLCMRKWPIADWELLLMILVQNMQMLSVLDIQECPVTELVTPRSSSISGLTKLRICQCHSLEKIDIGPMELQNLHSFRIIGSSSLAHILGLRHLNGLVELSIESCRIEVLIEEKDAGHQENISFPSLKVLILRNLSELRRICGDEVLFPSLRKFTLEDCPKLERLPRGLVNENIALSNDCNSVPRWWWNRLRLKLMVVMKLKKILLLEVSPRDELRVVTKEGRSGQLRAASKVGKNG